MHRARSLTSRGDIASLRVVGGDIALDFVNTITGRLTSDPSDFLEDFECLARWSVHAGVITAQEREACALAAVDTRLASSVHGRALDLRAALYELVVARAHERSLPGESLDALNDEIARTRGLWRLAGDGGVATWQCSAHDPALPLARVALAGARILTESAPRPRLCAGAVHGCAWLFIDQRRGGTRRWCSMEGCGNRAKAREHYRRLHQA